VKLAFVLLQRDVPHLARATRDWLVHGWGADAEDVCSRSLKTLDPLATGATAAWVAAQLRDVVEWIESEAEARGGPPTLRGALGVVDLYDPGCAGLQPGQVQVIGQMSPVMALASLLLLAYPEIHWLPYSSYSSSRSVVGRRSWDEELRRVASREAPEFPVLFDSRELRERIRGWLRAEPDGRSQCGHLPHRTRLASAIDEEEAYAAFNAYLAYRSGYRSLMVTSESLMRSTLDGDFEPTLTFEDLYLGFPDRSGGHWSKLQNRDTSFPGLKKARHRVIVTVGHARDATRRETARRNRDYLRSWGQSFVFLYKPLPGFHRTWSRARPRGRVAGVSRDVAFVWPPKNGPEGGEPRGHSAPGRLLAAAESLLARAGKLLSASTVSVVDAIHAATLAQDAKELLGGKTPTVALNAVALQHEAEVTAESLFLGVEHNLDLCERFQEIELEVRAVAGWFHRTTRRRSELNARLTIIERLAKRFAELHQVEEEMACLAEARRLRFDFWVRERWYRWPMWPVLRYLALALKSLPAFVGILAAWAVLFGLSHYVLANASPRGGAELWDAMASAWKVFFTGEPAAGWAELVPGVASSWNTGWTLWLTFEGIISFTSLGMLLSHLYLIVSRR